MCGSGSVRGEGDRGAARRWAVVARAMGVQDGKECRPGRSWGSKRRRTCASESPTRRIARPPRVVAGKFRGNLVTPPGQSGRTCSSRVSGRRPPEVCSSPRGAGQTAAYSLLKARDLFLEAPRYSAFPGGADRSVHSRRSYACHGFPKRGVSRPGPRFCNLRDGGRPGIEAREKLPACSRAARLPQLCLSADFFRFSFDSQLSKSEGVRAFRFPDLENWEVPASDSQISKAGGNRRGKTRALTEAVSACAVPGGTPIDLGWCARRLRSATGSGRADRITRQSACKGAEGRDGQRPALIFGGTFARQRDPGLKRLSRQGRDHARPHQTPA